MFNVELTDVFTTKYCWNLPNIAQ